MAGRGEFWQTSSPFEPHGPVVMGVVVGPKVGVVVGPEVGPPVVPVGPAVVVPVGVVDRGKQQSSEESKLGKVVLSQPSETQTRSPKQSLSVSQSPWPSPH